MDSKFEIDEIAKEVDAKYCDNIDTVKRFLHKNESKYQGFSLLMFRAVMEPIHTDYTFLRNKHISVERLKQISTSQIFCHESVSVNDKVKNKYLNTMLGKRYMKTLQGIIPEPVLLQYVNNLFKCNSLTAYARDLDSSTPDILWVLDDFQSYISESSGQERMPDINTPMHYVGGSGSFTALHEEDGGLSSINILKNGQPKIWIIVDYLYQADVERAVADHLQNILKTNVCPQTLKHKL